MAVFFPALDYTLFPLFYIPFGAVATRSVACALKISRSWADSRSYCPHRRCMVGFRSGIDRPIAVSNPNLKPEICSRQGNRTLAIHQHENGIEPLPIHQYAASVILCLIADGRHLRHHPSAFFVVVYYALIPALGRALSASRCPCLHVSGISIVSMFSL